MRYVLLGIATILVATHADVLRYQAQSFGLYPEPAAVTAAVSLRCSDLEPTERGHCGAALRRDFATGAREPGAIVRLHCTPVENPWKAPEPLPAICKTVDIAG